MKRLLGILVIVAVLTPASFAADPIKALIVNGKNNHNWRETTKAVKATLEKTGRFEVDVSTSPSRGGSDEDWKAWRPKFSDYQVVIGDFNDDCEEDGGCEMRISKAFRDDFEHFVREGGGFVPVHAADNSWSRWEGYNDIIGIGGWGGRQAGVSGYLLRKIDGEWQTTSPNEGRSGTHGREAPFAVVHEQPDHPILKDLPTEWMHAKDELYASLRGPAQNIEVLAYSTSVRRQSQTDEPILMVVTYGKGKVFHLPLGHYNDEEEPFGQSLHCVGFQTVLARGTEFVATGKVTIGIPDSFPGKETPSIVSPSEVAWPTPERQRSARSSRKELPKHTKVFGIDFYATADAPDDKFTHAINVLAKWLDSDEDGVPDNQKIVDAMIEKKATMVAAMNSQDLRQYAVPFPNWQNVWTDNVRPLGENGKYDEAIEEILHLITDYGWENAYPDAFARKRGTRLANASEAARGGYYFEEVPDEYPESAWHQYYDKSCDYGCHMAEYLHWALTSILGGQDYPGSFDRGGDQWKLRTRELMQSGDPGMYALLTDPQYKLPTVLPDGKYSAKEFVIHRRP